MNAPIGATWDMRNLGDFVIRGGEDGQRIPDASLVLISVANSGRVNVTEKDFAAPMRFAFDGRKVKGFEVFEMSPPELADTLRPGQAASTANVGVTFDEDKLFVPPVTLNAGERFKLLVLLSGTGHSVNGGAHIRGGKFIPGNNAISARRTPHNPMRSRRICG
ncbi:MAG TPA: hypothetical protein VGS19_36735 [Streptosporangiaceae bacterium]|nr:hypothetical protein [Streptosporangiaceae bacterium]